MTVAEVAGAARHVRQRALGKVHGLTLSAFPSEPPAGYGPAFCGAKYGALAQLGERLICIQEVRSSILLGSTNVIFAKGGNDAERKHVAKQGACEMILFMAIRYDQRALCEAFGRHIDGARPADLLRRSATPCSSQASL